MESRCLCLVVGCCGGGGITSRSGIPQWFDVAHRAGKILLSWSYSLMMST